MSIIRIVHHVSVLCVAHLPIHGRARSGRGKGGRLGLVVESVRVAYIAVAAILVVILQMSITLRI